MNPGRTRKEIAREYLPSSPRRTVGKWDNNDWPR